MSYCLATIYNLDKKKGKLYSLTKQTWSACQ